MAEPDAKAAPKPPPNLRVATDEGEECEVCSHFDRGRCVLYNHLPVDDEWVCDSFAKGGTADNDDGPEPKNLKQAAQKAHRLRRNARKQADEESSEKKPDDESSEQQK